MQFFSHKRSAVIFIMIAAILSGACSGSGRTGAGPYDFTDYSALDAQQEIREAQMEMTKYPIDDYYDMLAEEEATQAAADAMTDYLYEEYLREKESGGY